MVASSEKARKVSVNSELEPPCTDVSRGGSPVVDRAVTDTRGLDTAEYIADLSREMARMARDAKLDLLASILEIARLEAQTAWKRLSSQARQG